MSRPISPSPATSAWKLRLYERYTSNHVASEGEQVRSLVAARMPFLNRIVQRQFPAARSVRILDLGCGYGALLVALRQAGYTHLAGVDVSEEQISAARDLGDFALEWCDLLTYLQARQSASFDVVAALDVLEHFTCEELLTLVDEIARVLSPGGRLIVHVPNGEAIAPGVIRYGDFTHELAFTPASLRQLANACGLKVIEFAEDTPVAHGAVSNVRAFLWQTMTIWPRILRMAEIGCHYGQSILSQNLLAVMVRPE